MADASGAEFMIQTKQENQEQQNEERGLASAFFSKLAVAGAVAVGTAGLTTQSADAAAMRSLDFYGDHKALAMDPMYKWAGAVKRIGSNGTTYASAVMIAPDLYINAGHFTPINGSLVARHVEIVFGSNYNTSTERYSVKATQRFPGYVFGDPSTIDLGIGWTNEFVAGFDAPTTFATTVLGERLTQVDYGNIGDPTTGEMPSLGDKMAGYAPRTGNFFSSYPDSRYDFMNFNQGVASETPLNVKGLNGSSGSPWYNASGDLTHLTVAGTLGSEFGNTVGLELTNPEVQAVLQPLIIDSWMRYRGTVPEPTALGLLAPAAAMLLRRERRS